MCVDNYIVDPMSTRIPLTALAISCCVLTIYTRWPYHHCVISPTFTRIMYTTV